MLTQIFSVRGATTAAADTKEEIAAASVILMEKIAAENGLKKACFEITSIICSVTPDITAAYPVAAIRENGYHSVPLFSCMEPDIQGGLKLCIRLLVNVSSADTARHEPKHIYLNGAKKLRPDLSL